MADLAHRLARWATEYRPSGDDLALADLALTDTVSVALAARDEPILEIAAELSRVGRWAVAAHILDFDDLHLPSTTHISTICVPAALASGSGPEGYLAGAGVMARLGTALGHEHYTRGWHATSTAGAVATAAVESRALGLNQEQTARSLALAVSCAGGVQNAFGTDAKSLQIGFAASAGVRAARLVARGASASTDALDQWVEFVGGDPAYELEPSPAIPDGLAIKLFPCCYALQRPIGAVRRLVPSGDDAAALADATAYSATVRRVLVGTPASTIKPLIYRRPQTGLQGKFSLEYSVATAILDRYPGFASFTDQAVTRPEAQRLLSLVEVHATPAGQGLLAGEVEVSVETAEGISSARLAMPPGSTANPASPAELSAKFDACLAGGEARTEDMTWASAGSLLDSLWAGDGAAPS